MHTTHSQEPAAAPGADAAHAGEAHVTSYRLLAGVLAALLVLTGITILMARVDVGAMNIWLTLLIAATKSSLVLMFFMHLKHEPRVFKTTLLVTVFTLALFVGFMFWDVAFRALPGE